VSHPKRLDTSSATLWEPQVSQSRLTLL
jgi:hypothetical protein